jgi:methoxymalonate biosynthesis protein
MTVVATPEVLDELTSASFRDRAEGWEQAGELPPQVIPELSRLGLFGLHVPVRYGGSDAPLTEVVKFHEAIAAASPSVHNLLVVHSMTCLGVTRWGSDPLREERLPGLAAGTPVAAFAVTEDGAGNDIGGVATQIRRDGPRLRIDGCKRWVSFGQLAGVFLVFGRLDGAGAAVLVDRHVPGLEVVPRSRVVGFRAAMLADLAMSSAAAPTVSLVGRPGFGLSHVATSCLTLGRVLVGAGAIGVAREALVSAARHVATRTAGGRQLADRQLVQGLLADAKLAVEGGRALVHRAAVALAGGHPRAAIYAVAAKLAASRAAALTTHHALQLHGAAGLVEHHPLARAWAAAKVYEVIEGSTEVLQGVLAADLVRCCLEGDVRNDDER